MFNYKTLVTMKQKKKELTMDKYVDLSYNIWTINLNYRSAIPCSRPEVANNYFRLFFPFAVDKFRLSRFTHSPWLRVLKVFTGFACRILAVG
jgi:hypothetical protein